MALLLIVLIAVDLILLVNYIPRYFRSKHKKDLINLILSMISFIVMIIILNLIKK